MERIKEILDKFEEDAVYCYATGNDGLGDAEYDETVKEITTYIIGEVSKLPTYHQVKGGKWVEERHEKKYKTIKLDDVEKMLKGESAAIDKIMEERENV